MRIRLIDCGKCESCCHGIPGHGIAARLANGSIPKIIKSGRCEYLGRNNSCNKGQNRPIECAWYPLRFFQDGIYIDKSCPGWESALEQFKSFMSFMPEEIKEQGKPELIMGWVKTEETDTIRQAEGLAEEMKDNHAQIFASVNKRFDYLKSRWVKGLISGGVKASHPDDGWVGKVKNEVKFYYPHFKQSISVGI